MIRRKDVHDLGQKAHAGDLTSNTSSTMLLAMSKESLTPRQQQILELVRNFAADNGYPPTVRELCRLAGVSSPDTVQYHLDNLREKGLLGEAKGRSRAAHITSQERVALIPILGAVPAGPASGAYAETMGHVPTVMDRGDASGLFALKVKGDSMESTLWDGDTVVVRWQETASSNDVVVVRYEDGEATVKRLKVKPSGLLLVPDNTRYEPFDIGEGRIAGKVISLIRKL
jgi:repressor LexA